MKRVLTFKRLTSIFVLAFTISILSFLVAKASFSTLPTALPDFTTTNYLRLSTIGDDDSTGANDYAPALSVLVYKDASSVPGIAKLHFNSGDSCKGKTIQYASVPADDTGSKTSPDGLWRGEVNIIDENDPEKSKSTIDPCKENIKIPPESFKPSSRFGGTIQVAIVRIQLVSSGVFTFNIGRIDNNDRIRLSTIGFNNTDSSDSNFPKSYGTLLKVRGGGSQVVAKFGVPCGFNKPGNIDPYGGQRKIFWKGADSQTDINPGKISVNVQGGSGQTVVPDAGKGVDIKYAGPIAMNAGDKFTVTFSGITNSNNAILLWLPFDSAAYDKDCSTGDNWKVDWTDGHIGRGGAVLDQTVGNIAVPDLPNSPEPGQTFNYVFDAENTGTRNISNIYYTKVCTDTVFNNSSAPNPWCARYTGGWTGYHYREYSQYYHAVNLGYNPQFNTVPPDYLDYLNNTQTTPVTKYTTATPGGALLYNNTGNNVAPGDSILTAGQRTAHSWGVSADDGGKSFCVQLTASPSKGVSKTSTGLDVFKDPSGPISYNTEHTTSWTIDSTATSSMLCVHVPHFYNLLLEGINPDPTVQQGSNIEVNGPVRETNQGLDTTRPHTNTKDTMERGIVEVKLAPGQPEPVPSVVKASQVVQAPCNYIVGKTGADPDTCNKDFGGSRKTNWVTAGATENLSGSRGNTVDPVGTKYCYATYAQHPRNINNDDYTNGDSQYSYSNISCSVIVKSPKVHFLNNDLTVGRLRDKAADGSCVVSGAPIITRGVPDSVNTNNYYGSWVANGAFATGAINGFGSAARPLGLAGGGHDNLLFGNQSTGAGQYSYSNCLPNPFGEVKDNDSTNLASHDAFVLKADDPTTGMLTLVKMGDDDNDKNQDKTGYVSEGKSIEVGQKIVAPPPSPVPPNSVMTEVRINAKSVHANPGNVSCPKLQVIVTGDNSSRDQHTKTVCTTGHEDYVYNFYLPTSGPKTIDVRFVNDSSGGGAVNRDIQIRTISANNKNLYTGTSGTSASGVNVTVRGAAESKSSCRTSDGVLLDIGYSSSSSSYCYSSLLLNGNLDAPLPPAAQNPSYIPPEPKTIQVTAKGTIYNLHGGAGACPYMYISVNGGQRQDLQEVCDTSESTYTFTTNIGDSNVDNVEVGFDPMDAWGGGQDRNLYVSNIKVDDKNFAINSGSESQIQFKNGSGNTFVSAADAPSTCKNTDTGVFMSATDNVTTGYCAVVRVNDVTPPVTPPPPVTPLDDEFAGFNGRDIVIYAKKTTGDTCNSSSTGNITINQNIVYKRTGFTSLFDLPRVTFIADCNIIIDDAVTDVNASLIAGDAIKTCSIKATNQDKCNQTLLVKGNISANRLLLWRTHGADLSVVGDTQPGETFDVSPAQVISRYNRDQRSAKPMPTYEVDLPPRY